MLRNYIINLLEKSGRKNIASFCKIATFKVEKGFSNENAIFLSSDGRKIIFHPRESRPCVPDWNAGISFHQDYMHYIKNEFDQELPFSRYF